MLQVINELEATYSEKNLIIVSHGSPIWMLYSALNSLNEEETIAYKGGGKLGSKEYFIKTAEPIIVSKN